MSAILSNISYFFLWFGGWGILDTVVSVVSEDDTVNMKQFLMFALILLLGVVIFLLVWFR